MFKLHSRAFETEHICNYVTVDRNGQHLNKLTKNGTSRYEKESNSTVYGAAVLYVTSEDVTKETTKQSKI